MLKRLKFVALATALAVGGAMGTAAYAQSSQGTSQESGTPGNSTMHGDGMMQGGDMMGMMNMMSQMTQMMETCNKMMQNAMLSPTDPERLSAPTLQQKGG
jgi:hypothetical protein